MISVTLPPFLSADSSLLSSSSSSSEQHPWVQEALTSIALVIRINDHPAPPDLLSSLSAAAIRALLSQVIPRHFSSSSSLQPCFCLKFNAETRSIASSMTCRPPLPWLLRPSPPCIYVFPWFVQVGVRRDVPCMVCDALFQPYSPCSLITCEADRWVLSTSMARRPASSWAKLASANPLPCIIWPAGPQPRVIMIDGVMVCN
jgi:hypothetical protein